MPVINGVYLKDFPGLPGAVADANIIPIAISGNKIAYRTTVSGIVTDARVTSKLLTGLSVTGGAISATDTILEAFGKVQNQINGKQDTITLTTIGTSGAATFIANTLNIPNYADGGVLSLSAIGATPNANAATITGTVLNLQPASASFGGVVTTVTQTFAGDKTLTGALVGTTGSFASNGGSDTFGINHSSGAGIALNITKGGSGEGIYVNKTSGSGNAATIIGTLNATTLVKSGGTSSQFLMADGSVNTSVLPSGDYLPLTGGTLTGALSGTSATFSGLLTSTLGNNTVLYNAVSATTGYQYANIQSGNARLIFGIEAATSAGIFTGTLGNSAAIGSSSATGAFHIASNSIVRQTIFSGGNVGIGTTTDAGYKLHVTDGYVLIGIDKGVKFDTSGSSGHPELSVDSSADLSFKNTAGFTNVVIKNDGNVGIGTASPSDRPLTIYNSNSATLYQTPTSGTTNTSGFYVGQTSDVSYVWNYNNFPLVFGTNNTERMRLDSAGNLGLGVTPSAWGSTYKVLQFPGGYVGSDSSLVNGLGQNFVWSGSGNLYVNNGFSCDYYQYLGQHVWRTAPSGTAGNAISFTQAMTLTSGNNLLVGTTTDAGFKLDVNGTARFSSTITTAAPSGGTAKPFKIGNVATVTPTSQNRTIEIEIDGTTYYLTAKTTND
jgi:hypothetical protein